MKVRHKIIGALGLMIFMVSCTLALFMAFSAGGIRRRGDAMLADLELKLEDNVRRELTDLADSIGNYVVALETEIDRTMLNAARTLYEADRLTGGRLTRADLERLKKDTGMSDLYLGDLNGVFTLSTEPESLGISLFDIWDGYRMLVTGESDYLPSDMKIKVETGEIFKFTAIPRSDGRGVMESALNAGAIEMQLQNYLTAGNGIRSMNLFDSTLLTLTGNLASGQKGIYTRGAAAPADTAEITGLFKDASRKRLSLDKQDARLYHPVLNNGRVQYVLFMDVDTTGYFALDRLIAEPVEDLIREVSFLNMISLVSVFIVLVVFTVFIAFLISRLLGPLGFFNKVLGAFSKGDFTLPVPERLIWKKDEMGEMALSFRDTAGKIKNLISVIRDQSLSLRGIGGELSSHMVQTARDIDGITANIRGMKEQTGKQAQAVGQTGGSVGQIMDTVKELHEQIAVQSENVSRSSEVIEGMLKNIHRVVETLAKNTENVSTLNAASEMGRTDLQKVSADIQEIARESEGLLEINSVMENIASQTNLLSMNAAIEAAHAGEAGKGFAVVAQEIRKLAESSGRQSKTTADMLRKIKTSIDAITLSMAAVIERFQSIEQEVKTVSSQEGSIRAMMEDQERESRHVLEAIGELNSITDLVRRGSEAMAGKSAEISRESGSLELITGEISGGMNDMAAGADHINAAVTRVKEICEENERSITALSDEIGKFKVD